MSVIRNREVHSMEIPCMLSVILWVSARSVMGLDIKKIGAKRSVV